ncbi:TPA: methyltetrahydrofolate cobalamin methyltransferase [Candidatus Poribacteria bacterium]|nr:methyltetrahydrofolate cobalamin methyltransferase [Candidatus Poribacteria bacterium]
MLIIGEKINTTKKSIDAAVSTRNAELIKNEAINQLSAGADVIDVNTGTRIKTEVDDMQWLVTTIQESTDCRLCIDSPNPSAIKAGLELCKQKPIVNSITGEKDRIDAIMPMVVEYGASVVALTMDEAGMPKTGEDRLRIATKIIDLIKDYNVPMDDIYFDALIQPVGSNPDQGLAVLEGIKLIRQAFPEAHIVCGLSNISYGLPERKLLNRTFLPMAINAGLDSAIMDPTDKMLMASVLASLALLGQDEYCLNYISSWRQGKLTF